MFGCTKRFFEHPVKLLCPVPLSVSGIKGCTKRFFGRPVAKASLSLFACGTCMPWKVHAPTTTQKDGIRNCGNWQEKLIQAFMKQSLCSSPSKPPLKSVSCSWQQEDCQYAGGGSIETMRRD